MPRFTSHGEVVFEQSSQGRLIHNFWGDYRNYWPGEAKPASGSGCQTCGQPPPPPPVFQNIEDWFARIQAVPSDFHEHMTTLRDLAAKSEVAVELSRWLKPSCLSLAAGKPKKFVSVCPGAKPEWPQVKQLLEGTTEFVSVLSESLMAEPFAHDLLFIDTWHRDSQLTEELKRWAPHCSHYIVIHCTITFGEKGDDGGPGVLPALRRFLKENPQWFVMNHYTNNNGLVVLSCDPADKKPLPSGLKMAWNYTKALTKHVATGRKTLPQVEIEKRLEVCLTCDQRVDNRCAVCGCYLDEGPNGEEGKTMWPEQSCPLGKWDEIPL